MKGSQRRGEKMDKARRVGGKEMRENQLKGRERNAKCYIWENQRPKISTKKN
jgi:hypothetical protein